MSILSKVELQNTKRDKHLSLLAVILTIGLALISIVWALLFILFIGLIGSLLGAIVSLVIVLELLYIIFIIWKSLLKMLLQNMKRNKRRSLLALISIGLALISIVGAQWFIFFMGLIGGLLGAIGGLIIAHVLLFIVFIIWKRHIFKIAFRNLLRHKRRTILTGVVISFGLWMYIFMDSVMNGLDRGSMDNMINLSTSALQIYTREYDEDKESYPLKHGLKDLAGIEKTLRTHERVKSVTPRTKFLGELSNYEESTPVIGTIVDPSGDKTVFTLTEYLVGDYFSDENEREIILGKDLAREMKVEPGGFITLYALTKYESRNADDFKVVGLFNTTDPALNKNGVYISFNAANSFLDLENTVTEMNVQLKHRINFDDLLDDMLEVQSLVKKELPALQAYSFKELGAGILALVKGKKSWGAGMTLVFLLIAAVGIVNSVLMSVYERIREVGVLRAMGMGGKDITWMFMFEGIMIGFVGSLGGVLLGVATVIFLTTYGYPLDKIYGDVYIDTTGFPLWGTIYGEWNIPLIIGVFIFGMLVAFLASIPPARKAAKMEVTHALRFI